MAWLTGLGLVLAGCGGSGDAPGAPRVGIVSVTVTDAFGAPVVGAVVSATLQGGTATGTTDAQGLAQVLVSGSSGTAEVSVDRPSFDGTVVSVPVTIGDVTPIAVTLDRTTAAAGGSRPSGSGAPPTVEGAARARLTFEVELVVIGRDGQPVGQLGVNDFALLACAPDLARSGDECVSGGDLAYTPVTAAPLSAQVITADVPQPFASVLLMDQSGSITLSDPTGARLYAAKSMLTSLGPDDQVLLAAFADIPDALIPTTPLTVFGPIRGSGQVQSYFAELDALGPLVGGATPLYAAIDAVVSQIASDPLVPVDKARTVVVFTDARDTRCGDAASCGEAREAVIAQALASQVRLFAIGLSDEADTQALAELAWQTGGVLFFAQTAEQLTPIYSAIGQLLGRSMPTYRLRFTVETTATGGFPSGGQLLGRVSVAAGAERFALPVFASIP